MVESLDSFVSHFIFARISIQVYQLQKWILSHCFSVKFNWIWKLMAKEKNTGGRKRLKINGWWIFILRCKRKPPRSKTQWTRESNKKRHTHINRQHKNGNADLISFIANGEWVMHLHWLYEASERTNERYVIIIAVAHELNAHSTYFFMFAHIHISASLNSFDNHLRVVSQIKRYKLVNNFPLFSFFFQPLFAARNHYYCYY